MMSYYQRVTTSLTLTTLILTGKKRTSLKSKYLRKGKRQINLVTLHPLMRIWTPTRTVMISRWCLMKMILKRRRTWTASWWILGSTSMKVWWRISSILLLMTMTRLRLVKESKEPHKRKRDPIKQATRRERSLKKRRIARAITSKSKGRSLRRMTATMNMSWSVHLYTRVLQMPVIITPSSRNARELPNNPGG